MVCGEKYSSWGGSRKPSDHFSHANKNWFTVYWKRNSISEFFVKEEINLAPGIYMDNV